MKKRRLNLKIISDGTQKDFCAIVTKRGRIIGKLDCKMIQIEINTLGGNRVFVEVNDIVIADKASAKIHPALIEGK